MADPFATALVALHAGPAAVAAVYNGGATPIRVIKTTIDIDLPTGAGLIRAGTTTIEIARAAVAAPIAGDELLIDGVIWTIDGEPKLDIEGVAWLCEAVAG